MLVSEREESHGMRMIHAAELDIIIYNILLQLKYSFYRTYTLEGSCANLNHRINVSL